MRRFVLVLCLSPGIVASFFAPIFFYHVLGYDRVNEPERWYVEKDGRYTLAYPLSALNLVESGDIQEAGTSTVVHSVAGQAGAAGFGFSLERETSQPNTYEQLNVAIREGVFAATINGSFTGPDRPATSFSFSGHSNEGEIDTYQDFDGDGLIELRFAEVTGDSNARIQLLADWRWIDVTKVEGENVFVQSGRHDTRMIFEWSGNQWIGHYE